MTSDESNRIISEEYADLLIEYNGDETVFSEFPNSTVDIINSISAVVHIPVQEITNLTIQKLGYSVMPSLFSQISNSSLEASVIIRIRNLPNFNLRGQGVLVGIIDSGVDYTNPIFQNADKTTRIAAIWDQTIVSGNTPEGINYGTEYSRDQINQALQSDNPLEVVPSKDENGHGTMVAGIAGGNEVQESNFSGVAPEVVFAVVKLKRAKKYLRDFFSIPEQAVCYQETDILFALEYLLHVGTRLQQPMVLCMAIGTGIYKGGWNF